MKTKFLLLAAIGTLLLATACTNDDEIAPVVQTAEEEMPVAFDTYLNSNSQGSTRAYSSGLFKTTDLQTDGFGIFAYNTSSEWSTAKSTATPNFMYNQQVTYSAGAWEYTPVKYWPNMTTKGTGDPNTIIDGQTGNDAYATSNAFVSFFAYAPYIPTVSNKTSGLDMNDGKVYGSTADTQVEHGITEIVSSTATGVPTISYTMNPDASQSQDLLWGTAPLSGVNYTAVNGNTIAKAAGLPLTDMVKPDTHTKIKFLFQHALAALRMDLNLAIDQLAAGGTLAENTTVKINSITLAPKGNAPTQGFATVGKLSLENSTANTPAWTSNGTDALTPGNLSIGGASPNVNINSALTTGITMSGDPLAFSPTLPAPVFGTTTTDALMFIPVYSSVADFDVTVTIDYDVITADEAHYGTDGEVTVNNVISKDVTLKSFRAGRLYALHLVLGLTSVKIDAEAQDWSVEEQVIDLPRNLD